MSKENSKKKNVRKDPVKNLKQKRATKAARRVEKNRESDSMD